VLWIQCAGSRDPEFHKPYCSRVCCNYTVKQARLYKEIHPEGAAFISYMDIRTDGKECEEFYHHAMEAYRIVYLRGRVSKVYRKGDRLAAAVADTLTRQALEVETDLVVLASAMVPGDGVEILAKNVRATVDGNGFLTESHIKLYPVESSTKGVYLAGCAQSPKDITDTVSQALAAGGKIMTMFARDFLQQDPLVVRVDGLVCSGCGVCIELCPYGARSIPEQPKIAEVNRALCEGCGACVAACPNKACELINQTTVQNLAMIDVFQQRERPA
jgi:heterodisulfide reductase subunit A